MESRGCVINVLIQRSFSRGQGEISEEEESN